MSYITGIMLLPVLYLLFYRIGIRSKGFLSKRFDNSLKNDWLERFYDKGMDWVFAHKKGCTLMTLATLPLCVFFFYHLEKERMPEIEQNELVMRIEWNENIHVDENRRRVEALMRLTDDKVQEHTAYVGMQDFILNGGSELSATEAELYFKTELPEGIRPLQELLTAQVKEKYPREAFRDRRSGCGGATAFGQPFANARSVGAPAVGKGHHASLGTGYRGHRLP